MLSIRLQRVGRKNDPSFRVIVTDSKLKPKTGNFLEVLGSYNARMGKPVINVERAKHWMSVGAKASGTVHNLLVDLKAVSGKKVNVLGKKTPIVKEVPAEAPKAAAPAAAAAETPAEAPAEVVAEAPVAEVATEATPEVVA
ncbi:MAG: 30S ribosomal protein S16 [Candidatus Paceibacterota bacterium]|jgi:small subunit ribosomal protein S16